MFVIVLDNTYMVLVGGKLNGKLYKDKWTMFYCSFLHGKHVIPRFDIVGHEERLFKSHFFIYSYKKVYIYIYIYLNSVRFINLHNFYKYFFYNHL